MSNSPQAWRERLGLGLLAGGALTLYLCADSFTLGQQLLLGGGLALGLAILLRRRWFTLVGPVLLHDMVRTARRSRFALYRLYAYFVLVLLARPKLRLPKSAVDLLNDPARVKSRVTRSAFCYLSSLVA